MGAGEVLLALQMVKQLLRIEIIASKGLASAADEFGEVDDVQSNGQITPGKFKCDLSVDKTKLESTKGQHAAWGWAGTKQDQLRLNAGDHSVSGVRITDASEVENNHRGWSVEWEEENIQQIDLSSLIEQQKREVGVCMQMNFSVLALTDLSSLGTEGTASNTKGKEETIPWCQDLDTADMALVASIKAPKRKRQGTQILYPHPDNNEVWVNAIGASTIAFSNLYPSSESSTATAATATRPQTTPNTGDCGSVSSPEYTQ
jgi:hypothetical protein